MLPVEAIPKQQRVRVALLACAIGAVGLFFALNLVLTAHLFLSLRKGSANVPWRDQWFFVKDWIALTRGEPIWRMLWAPYWGHRLVLPRLTLLADAYWFALRNTPLVVLNVALQIGQIALLAFAAWKVIGRASWLAWAAVVLVTWHLLLSSLQIENFIWGFQIQFGYVDFAALLAFVCLVQRRNGAMIAAAIAGTLSMANGLFISPVLALQAWLLRLPRRLIAMLLGGGVVVAMLYMREIPPRPVGMGAEGVVRHPIDALRAVAIVVGGPLSSTSIVAAEMLGWIGLLVAAWLLWRCLETMPHANVTVPAAVVCFTLLSSAGIVMGRMTLAAMIERAQQGLEPLASRYCTVGLLFWAGLFLWVMAQVRHRSYWPDWLALAAVTGVVLRLTVGTAHLQIAAANAWADLFRELNAASTAMLVGVEDTESLARLWPVTEERREWTGFLRARKASVFAEPRAGWMGLSVRHVIGDQPVRACEGAVDSIDPVPGQPHSWRLRGWVWDATRESVPADLLLVNEAEQVIGLGRSGLLHQDAGGRAQNARFYWSGWLGYVRTDQAVNGPPAVKLYAVLSRGQGACEVRREK